MIMKKKIVINSGILISILLYNTSASASHMSQNFDHTVQNLSILIVLLILFLALIIIIDNIIYKLGITKKK